MYTYFTLLCFIISGGFGKSLTNQVVLQYQDSIGQYSFGYSAPKSARSEIRLSDGYTRGAFSYVDDTGVIHTAKYTADSVNGFKIQSNNLPESPNPVEDTPEVKAARLDHLLAHEAVLKNNNEKNSQENTSVDANLKKKIPKSDVLISDEKKVHDVINETNPSISQSINSISNQLPNQMEIKRNVEIRQEIPVVKTSFILPKSNVNIQNRIELKAMDLSTSRASLQSMSQDQVKMPMKMMVKSEMMNNNKPMTIILRSVQRLPTVYSTTQYHHFVPTIFF